MKEILLNYLLSFLTNLSLYIYIYSILLEKKRREKKKFLFYILLCLQRSLNKCQKITGFDLI